MRENRTVTLVFISKARYYRLHLDGIAFIAFVADFITNIGFKLKHKPGCTGKSSLTRHSLYERVRLDGVPIWRVQCTACKAVCSPCCRISCCDIGR